MGAWEWGGGGGQGARPGGRDRGATATRYLVRATEYATTLSEWLRSATALCHCLRAVRCARSFTGRNPLSRYFTAPARYTRSSVTWPRDG